MSADFLLFVNDSLATQTNPNLSCHEIMQSALIKANNKVSEFCEEFRKLLLKRIKTENSKYSLYLLMHWLTLDCIQR